jgi:hypothetical protein
MERIESIERIVNTGMQYPLHTSSSLDGITTTTLSSNDLIEQVVFFYSLPFSGSLRLVKLRAWACNWVGKFLPSNSNAIRIGHVQNMITHKQA